MEALSRREENEVMASAKTNALKQCDDVVRDFADCATGRTFSVTFMCRAPLRRMQDCMRGHMTEAKLDALKLEYISNRSEKGRQAVEALNASRRERLHGKKEVDQGERIRA